MLNKNEIDQMMQNESNDVDEQRNGEQKYHFAICNIETILQLMTNDLDIMYFMSHDTNGDVYPCDAQNIVDRFIKCENEIRADLYNDEHKHHTYCFDYADAQYQFHMFIDAINWIKRCVSDDFNIDQNDIEIGYSTNDEQNRLFDVTVCVSICDEPINETITVVKSTINP